MSACYVEQSQLAQPPQQSKEQQQSEQSQWREQKLSFFLRRFFSLLTSFGSWRTGASASASEVNKARWR